MLKIRSLTLLPRVHVGELGLDVLFWESFSERSMISPGPAWRSLTHLMESKTSQLCWLSSVLINKHPSPSIQTISLQSSRSLCLVNLHNTLLYNNQDIYMYILYSTVYRLAWQSSMNPQLCWLNLTIKYLRVRLSLPFLLVTRSQCLISLQFSCYTIKTNKKNLYKKN